MRYLNLVLGFTIVVLVFIAGCSSNSVKESVVPTTTPSLPPSTTIVTTTVVGSPVITPPILTATPSLNPTDTTSHNAAQTIATPIPQLTKIAADDPFINNIQLHKYVYGLNDCIMKQAFPDIANDPNYGLKATPPKLIGISNEKWNSFYQDFITGKNTGQSQTFSTSKCINFPYAESTTWDMSSV